MEETHDSGRIQGTELESFVLAVLRSVGVGEEHARHVAASLVEADLRGVNSHGVARLEAYVENFEQGGFSLEPTIEIEEAAPSVAIIHGDAGPGQSVGVTAMDEAIERASQYGVGMSFVRNSNHFGTASYFTQRAANQDYVGIAASNVGPDVIPYGGREAFLGTNPIAFSVPTPGDFPLTLDMATSTVAMGKIDHGADGENTSIPYHWAVDADGEPTDDPTQVAALQPLGGPKGYGLAIMVDLFCGLLSQTQTSPDIGDLYDDYDEPMELGHWFLALDVSQLLDPASFKAAVGNYIERIKKQPTARDVDEILVPGEPEARCRAQYEANGIPLTEETRAGLNRLANRYDVTIVV